MRVPHKEDIGQSAGAVRAPPGEVTDVDSRKNK